MSVASDVLAKVLILIFLSGWVYAGHDPWLDNKVACNEMEQFPETVFKSPDLGSGRGTKNTVDYHCPKSLNQLSFLKQLLSKADFIRSPSSLPRICTGSIVYAQWRYYHFGLARHGYYPQAGSAEVPVDSGAEYFERWSYQSLHNRKIYEDYIIELEKVRPLLRKWYEMNHSVDSITAQQYTGKALAFISNWGYGGAPQRKSVELVEHTDSAISGNYESFFNSLNNSSDEQKLNSLRRLLVHLPPNEIVEQLVSSVSNTTLEGRSESVISNAIANPDHVRILLQAGFDPNHQNEFGKTPLYYAIQFNQHESVRVLLENGANVNHAYHIDDKNWRADCIGITQWGRTPLMHAAQHSDTEMIQLLLDHEANIQATDVKGSSVLDYSKRNEKEGIESYLLRVVDSN